MKKLIVKFVYQLKARLTSEFINSIEETHRNRALFDTYLAHKINVNWLVNQSHSPLWLATLYNDVYMVSALLKAGADPNLGGNKKTSYRPITYALGKLFQIRLSGPSPRLTQEQERSHKERKEVYEQKALKITALLLKYGATPNKEEEQRIEKLRNTSAYFNKVVLEEAVPEPEVLKGPHSTDTPATPSLKARPKFKI